MTIIYSPLGRAVEVAPESVATWRTKGWSIEAPEPVVVPETLPTRVARKQSSDVTPPGQSEVEGDEPAHVASDEE